MAILGENRIGPNQDINDSTDLNTLRQVAQSGFNKLNDIQNSISGTNNDPQIITTRFVQDNGNIQDVSEALQSQSEINNIIAQSNINTYINQAERFRSFFNDLLNKTNNLVNSENIGTHLPSNNINVQIINSPTYDEEIEEFLTFDVRDRFVNLDSFVSASSPSISLQIPSISGINDIDIPVWSGSGPTNYNYGTYPQLISKFQEYNNKINLSGINSYSVTNSQTSVEDDVGAGNNIIGWQTIDFFNDNAIESRQGVNKSMDAGIQMIVSNLSNDELIISPFMELFSIGSSSDALDTDDITNIFDPFFILRQTQVSITYFKVHEPLNQTNLTDSNVLSHFAFNNAIANNIVEFTNNVVLNPTIFLDPNSTYIIQFTFKDFSDYGLHYRRHPVNGFDDDVWLGDSLPDIFGSLTILDTTYIINFPRILTSNGWS